MNDSKNLYIGAYILNKHARTEKHIKQIKKAHIDFMTSINYNDKTTLDLFEKYSLGAIVNGVFPSWWGSDGEKSGQMEFINPPEIYKKNIENYSNHNAVWGIDIGDEISSADFHYVNRIFETHKEFFKDKIMYMNLYPNYGVFFNSTNEERKKQWGCSSYDEYIEKYCKEISLPYICFDHYPYSHKNIFLYIENLKCVKETADKHHKSVYLVAQSSSYDKDAFLTQTQLRTQLYIALAFNVKVIMWACLSAGWWHNHILDEKGNKTKLYRDIKKVNCEIKKFFGKYSEYKCCGVYILNSKTNKSDSRNLYNFKHFKNIKAKDDSLYIICELKNIQIGKKSALYIVNVSENVCEAKISFECNNKPKIYCMNKNFKLKYDKQSNTHTLNLISGYGAIIEDMP